MPLNRVRSETVLCIDSCLAIVWWTSKDEIYKNKLYKGLQLLVVLIFSPLRWHSTPVRSEVFVCYTGRDVDVFKRPREITRSDVDVEVYGKR